MPVSEANSVWSVRPVLEHIRTLARSRRVGPWAVLGTAMARAVATIPAHVALPPTVGGRMSLNLFVALVGPSGAGKGGADAACAAGIKFGGPQVDHVPLGSGEGTSRTFRPLGPPAELPNPVMSVIFTVPEIDTLTALTSRQGSTLSAELRKLYSGEALGFANAGKETRNLSLHTATERVLSCACSHCAPMPSLGPLTVDSPSDSSGCRQVTLTRPTIGRQTPALGTYRRRVGTVETRGTYGLVVGH